MHPPDLEDRVGRSLERLPLPQAPDTLLPRVVAAVHAWARRPWYQRAWFTWPLGWQVASVIAMCLLVAGAVPVAQQFQTAAVARATAYAGGVASQFSDTLQLAAAARVALQAIAPALLPILYYAAAIVALMAAASITGALALNRILFGRSLTS